MKTIQKIVALFLSVLILLFSFGFTINKMVCLKSGSIRASLSDIQDCCSNEKETTLPVVKAHCCDLSSTAFHLNDYNPSEQHSVHAALNCSLILNQKATAPYCIKTSNLVLFYTDLPPPLHGKQLLQFISVFIIWFFIWVKCCYYRTLYDSIGSSETFHQKKN